MTHDDPMLTCARCGKQAPLSAATDWFARFEDGKLADVLCDTCTTGDEHVEAQVNVATMEFEVDGDGELHGKPKD